MIFHSFSYLLFFPIVFAVYYLLPKKARVIWLLAASYFFYGSADIRYVVLLLAITLLAYGSGLAIGRAASLQKTALAKGLLVITILGNLGILGYFKYVNFLLDNLNKVMTLMSSSKQFAQRNGLLTLGISFILFQSISYSVDVYRKTLPAEKNILHFALYLAFFPKLISGPIERADAVLKQIREPKNFSLTALKEGLSLLLLGLFYKLVLSDNIAAVINPVLETYADYSGLEITLAVILLSLIHI